MSASALFDVSFAGRSLARGAPINGITRFILELGGALVRDPTAHVRLTALGFGDPYVSSVLALQHCSALTRNGAFEAPFSNALLSSAASRALAKRISSSGSRPGDLLARGIARVVRTRARPIRADVFHSTAYVGPPSGLDARTRRVHTLYDLIPLSHPQFTTPSETASASAFVRSLRQDDWIVAISRWSADELRRRTSFPPERISIVPLAAASHFRVRAVGETILLRARLGLADEPFLVALGSSSPRKNLEAAVDAVDQLGSSAPTLVIVGDTTPRLRERVARSTARVLLMGDVSDDQLSLLYSACGAFVFPSIAEGFGLPPLEAMSCGAPMIAARGSALTELVEGAGILVELDDPDGLARAIHRVSGDSELRLKLSAAGMKRASEHSWAAAAMRTAKAYEAATA